MRLGLIVVTFGRPDALRRCLAKLHQQLTPPHEVIVVDGDDEEQGRTVCAEFPSVRYLRNPNGFGRMTGSRNLGLRHATADVVAYIDDDAYAWPDFVREILVPYADPMVGAVGGRALNGVRGEETVGIHEVGLLTANGGITGNFAADVPEPREVDHLIGCNMSFRRSVLLQLGGFHEFYPGFCSTYEEVDLCIRVKRLGYKVIFQPKAVVDHEGAPRRVGRRFDLGYRFRVTRNHATLIVRNFGCWFTARYAACAFGGQVAELCRKVAGATLGFVFAGAGLIVGLLGGVWQRMRQGSDLVRRDDVGAAIRRLGGADHDPSALPPT